MSKAPSHVRRSGHFLVIVLLAGYTIATTGTIRLDAQATGQPFAWLSPASPISLPGEADSNSPAIWELFRGEPFLFVLTSWGGEARNSVGRSVDQLTPLPGVVFTTAAPHGGVWFESVIDAGRTWYGYYHNERENVVCPGSGKVVPRIGAARSRTNGRTWEDQGPVLEAALATMNCTTRNHYFVGGVGDFSAVLDEDGKFLYFHYTQYLERDGYMGVSVARMNWADRDRPRGAIAVWNQGAWLPADDSDPESIGYPIATPVHLAVDRWDDRDNVVDAYWGPSVHWNTALGMWVMLLNRAVSADWRQGGIYVSFNADLANPAGWTRPALLLTGGRWYPQVMGLVPGEGTDKVAGATARFYMSGRSEHFINFGRR